MEVIKKNYWEYLGILIPNYVESVPHLDQINKVYKDGNETNLPVSPSIQKLTIKEYKEKYAGGLNIDNKIYFYNVMRLNNWNDDTILEKHLAWKLYNNQ